MSSTWDTKYGPRRVRHDPPTLSEAIAAAQGLTDDVAAQLTIAADLMGVNEADVKAEMRKLMPDRRSTQTITAPAAREKGARTVVVERKMSRRVMAKAPGAPQSR